MTQEKVPLTSMESENSAASKVVKLRRTADWIEGFQSFSQGIPSPAIFRKWAAISTIAGVLQRRVYTTTAISRVYPNLYTVLVAPPAVGKSQSIFQTYRFWNALNSIHTAPDNVTRASLIDCLEEAAVKDILPGKELLSYHALAVAASEFGVLVPAHEADFLSVLNHIYDCPPSYKENRRTRSKKVDIIHPTLNILAGSTPSYLSDLLPESAWSQGFTSRLILIYSAEVMPINLGLTTGFASLTKDNEKLLADLSTDLNMISKTSGELFFTLECATAIEAWAKTGLAPIPIHSRLQHYNGRRILHILKLMQISAISRGVDRLELADLERARDWLLEAEQHMPDIFRDMAGKSDKVVIDDLVSYMWQIYSRDRKPIHVSRITHFLSTKIPSEKILRLVDLCERSGVIQRLAGTSGHEAQYVPADNVPGVE